tara:strand:+ start:2261 stop:3034 length:774 start_codon:yes stop_codon:yes gene_type:complete
MKNKKPGGRRSRDRQDAREEIAESIIDPWENPNPIRRTIKVNQLPWTDKQKDFFKIGLNHDTKVMLVNGPAGTSKSLLSVYCGLQLLNMKAISDIMYLRSAVESSDSKLGYLPGTAEDKLRFYNMPFLDKLDELLPTTRAEKLEQEGRISMFPVNFARGMNWTNKCVILDEAQNSSMKEITTVLTRLGKGSRCFVLADPSQTDLRNRDQIGGFEKLYKVFTDQQSQEMGIHTFAFGVDDIMRSKLCKFIVKKVNSIR